VGSWDEKIVIIFLNERARECAYFIEKEGRLHAGGAVHKNNYTRATICASPLAPAKIHNETSPFILAMSEGTEDSRRSKVPALHSFQSSQVTSNVREREASRGSSERVVMFVHHSIGVAPCLHSRRRDGWHTQSATRLHTLLEYRHSDRRCMAVSIVVLHSGQKGLWSQFR
jgi:hypothetical protein